MIILGTDGFFEMGIKPLFKQGIINEHQYAECLRRREASPAHKRKNITVN